jgi:hypothetical protein
LTEDLAWHIQTRFYCFWPEDESVRQCPLRKELGLDGCLGVEPRRDGIALAEGHSHLERWDHFGWGRT